MATAVHEEKSSAEQPVAGKSGKGKGPKHTRQVVVGENEQQVPEEQVPMWFARVMDTFQVIDRDGNGLIAAAELRYVLTDLYVGVSEEVLQGRMAEADADGDGQINENELARFGAQTGRSDSPWAALLSTR